MSNIIGPASLLIRRLPFDRLNRLRLPLCGGCCKSAPSSPGCGHLINGAADDFFKVRRRHRLPISAQGQLRRWHHVHAMPAYPRIADLMSLGPLSRNWANSRPCDSRPRNGSLGAKQSLRDKSAHLTGPQRIIAASLAQLGRIEAKEEGRRFRGQPHFSVRQWANTRAFAMRPTGDISWTAT
jgi:hypothetical protein